MNTFKIGQYEMTIDDLTQFLQDARVELHKTDTHYLGFSLWSQCDVEGEAEMMDEEITEDEARVTIVRMQEDPDMEPFSTESVRQLIKDEIEDR